MQKSCTWLLKELADAKPSSLRNVCDRHRSRDDAFDLAEVLTFLPEKSQPELASLIQEAISKLVPFSSSPQQEDQTLVNKTSGDENLTALVAGIHMTWLLVQNRINPPNASLRQLIIFLNESIFSAPAGNSQNQISKICEWMWVVKDERRNEIVPRTILFLLLRSFGEENASHSISQPSVRRETCLADIRRVFAMRKSLDVLDLSQNSQHSQTLRNLLLRCTTAPSYLRADEGRKFLAQLLTLEDIQDAVFDALVNQLASVRKSSAQHFGVVFLMAWKIQRSDWLTEKLMKLSEQAVCAGAEPFASNLRTVFSSFHANKRVNGVDLLLNRIYGPVLYSSLMVANPLVRRNSVIVAADAFPIYDPGALCEDIEKAINRQCSKFLELLEDPSPIVRRACVEGTCKVLGLFWDLVPLASAKRMVDILTSKLAFDTSAAQVRLAVFEGLKFMANNHLAQEVLSKALPRLRALFHDKVERVRLSFLDLLISVKSKRLKAMRYHDIVPIEDLLLRLPNDSAAVTTKIMNLIVTSYFPLEKTGRTPKELAESRTRACLSMLESNRAAAKFFYRHVNLHVPPGPLCELAMAISEVAIELSAKDGQTAEKRESKRVLTRQKRTRRTASENKENVHPRSSNMATDTIGDGPDNSNGEMVNSLTLFGIAADILVAISPSLQKEKNKSLRVYLDSVYGEDALIPMLQEGRNSTTLRATAWRIAGCLSPSKIRPVQNLWRKQIGNMMEIPRGNPVEVSEFHDLFGALMSCGVRWNLLPTVAAVISLWTDTAISGCRSSSLGVKAPRRGNGTRSRKKTNDESRNGLNLVSNALFAIRASAAILLENDEVRELFLVSIAKEEPESCSERGHPRPWSQLVKALRKGVLGALDYYMESGNNGEEAQQNCSALLDSVAKCWKIGLMLTSSLSFEKTVHQELRELFVWFESEELWERALFKDESFAVALATLCLGYSADATALGYVIGADISSIETMTKSVAKLKIFDEKSITRAVVEITRIAFLLQEQCVLSNAELEREPAIFDSYEVQKAASSLIRSACEMLVKCRVENDGKLTGVSGKSTVLENYLCDTLLEMHEEGNVSEFQQTFATHFLTAFTDVDHAERNLLASLLCNMITSLATSSKKANVLNAFKLYSTLVSCMRFAAVGTASDDAVASISSHLVSSLLHWYINDAGDARRNPTSDSLQFFARIQDLLAKQFPDGEEHSGDSHCVPDLVHELRATLTSLRNMAEKDVERSKEPNNPSPMALNFDEDDEG